MDNEYGSDYITVIDEDGNEIELELIETLPLGSELYMAFLPADSIDGEDEITDIDADEEDGLIIMKVIEENGEELFATLDDDEELEYVYNKFMEVLFDDEEDADGDDSEN